MDTARKSYFHQNLENDLRYQYNLVLKNKEDFRKLKSRMQWLNEGDANTKFFHISTIQQHRRNRTLGLNDFVGKWTYNQKEI